MTGVVVFNAAGGNFSFRTANNALIAGQHNAVAVSFSQERASVSANGSVPVSVTPTSTLMPNSLNSLIIGDLTTATSRKLEGCISLFNYYPTEIAGADLQTLTAAAFNM